MLNWEGCVCVKIILVGRCDFCSQYNVMKCSQKKWSLQHCMDGHGKDVFGLCHIGHRETVSQNDFASLVQSPALAFAPAGPARAKENIFFFLSFFLKNS